MNRTQVRIRDIRDANFLENFKDHYSFDGETEKLTLKDLALRSDNVNDRFVYQILTKISPDADLNILELNNVEFQPNSITLEPNQKLILDSCVAVGRHEFYRRSPRSLEIINCDMPDFRFLLNSKSLLIQNSNVGYFKIDDSESVLVKTINIRKGSKVQGIIGLESLLEEGNSTVVLFSQDSEILEDKDLSYRILRVIAQRFNDVVQSQILHSKILENYVPEADFWNTCLLWLEKVSNNFGLSFIRPIGLMFLINIIFVGIYYTFGVFSYNFQDFILSSLNINPLNRFVQSTDYTPVSWQRNADVIRQLLLSVLTYQTIVAARRFSFKR